MEPNTLYPGRPNYSGPTKGLFSWVHHDIPYEFSDDIRVRIVYIHTCKPEQERATRLNAIAYLDPTGQGWEEAVVAYKQAKEGYSQARRDYYHSISLGWPLGAGSVEKEAHQQARMLYEEAWTLFDTYRPQIMEWIATLVPDVQWNSKGLIFPRSRHAKQRIN